jgi:flagellar biosynthesis/type III secretory pathway M-ring protein FliF/YscJ
MNADTIQGARPGAIPGAPAAAGERFAPTVIDFDHIEGRIEKSLVQKVRKLVEDFPERALEVIRAWMAEGA